MRGGHLYGSLIDIVRFGAPLMLVALGMTLVIATGGIDLSVGAVVAISGALRLPADQSTRSDQNSLGAVLVAVAAALGLSHAARPLERRPRRGDRHPADHRDADPDGRRPRASPS